MKHNAQHADQYDAAPDALCMLPHGVDGHDAVSAVVTRIIATDTTGLREVDLCADHYDLTPAQLVPVSTPVNSLQADLEDAVSVAGWRALIVGD